LPAEEERSLPVDRVIECECGWKCDRDVNAALVILRKGLAWVLNRP